MSWQLVRVQARALTLTIRLCLLECRLAAYLAAAVTGSLQPSAKSAFSVSLLLRSITEETLSFAYVLASFMDLSRLILFKTCLTLKNRSNSLEASTCQRL